jgi:beta-N-acetylhexosaminidase
MGAAYRSDGGLAVASVSALNAGVDLILISYDPDQYFPIVHALLRAEAHGTLARDALERSHRRLKSVIASEP